MGSTRECLKFNGLPQPAEIMIIDNECKVDVVAEIRGKVDGVIDDAPSHLQALMRKNAVIYTSDRPWNRHVTTHVRISMTEYKRS